MFALEPSENIIDAISIKTEEIIPIITNTVIIDPIILPSHVILSMFTIAEAIEKNTSGIRTMNNKLINISPNGLIVVAFSLNISTTTVPIKMEINKVTGKRYGFSLVIIEFSPFS